MNDGEETFTELMQTLNLEHMSWYSVYDGQAP
jgi:hypothetical protein